MVGADEETGERSISEDIVVEGGKAGKVAMSPRSLCDYSQSVVPRTVFASAELC